MDKKKLVLTVAELVDAFRMVPRLILIGYAILVWTVVQWYMGLPDPSTQHAALVTIVVGIIAPIVGLYQSSGRTWGKKDE